MNDFTNKKKWSAYFLLLLVAFFWGITFTIVKDAISHVDVFVFLAQRFILSFFLLLPVCFIWGNGFKKDVLIKGTILGLFLFAAYAFQTLGLKFTTASNTAFLTGLNVVFVPLIGWIFYKESIENRIWVSTLLCGIGLYFLTLHGSRVMNKGDTLVLVCALCVAFQIHLTGRYTKDSNVAWLTTIQLGTVAACSFIVAKASGKAVFFFEPKILWALIICILFATIFAFLVQTFMQRFISPTHTAIIFCMEPVFGALYAHLFGGERFDQWNVVGASLILAGMLISQIPFSGRVR